MKSYLSSAPIFSSLRHRLSWWALLGTTGLAVAGLLSAQPTTPPSGPTVNLNEPVAVVVTSPVQVTGAVALVNDEVAVPYAKSASATIGAGGSLTGLPAKFDIPPGKRLVVETIGIRARIAGLTGSKIRVSLTHPGDTLGQNVSVGFPMQYEGHFDTADWFAAVFPFKATIDAFPGSADAELFFEMTTNATIPSAEGASLHVSVYGRLVDL
jgi:hypothetical protein